MKKLLTLAAMATLLMAGSVFAAQPNFKVAQPNATFAFGTGGAAAGPTTTNNDDTCDIAVEPAATLLLPYFEVETASRATDTFFTIINTSAYPQIAHVVVWTDWSFPVLDFNVFLTGYDVQPLSMYDIIVNGIIAPNPGSTTTGGTSSNTTEGSISELNTSNPNITSLAACGSLPGVIPGSILTNLQNALIRGTFSGCAGSVGSAASTHTTTTTAIGYVTVDVVSYCSPNMPDSPAYAYTDLLFDNVLTGDYEILNKATGSNYAGGNPLVHIRAIPEGGPASTPLPLAQTNFPYTFYSRYINGQNPAAGPAGGFIGANLNYDRRQPLPSTFAARYIQGGATSFDTSFRIWREGRTTGTTGCGTSSAVTNNNAVANSAIAINEIVRFDEHENPNVYSPNVVISPSTPATVTLPETSNTRTAGSVYPTMSSPAGDNGGWMWLNLNSNQAFGGSGGPSAANAVNTTLHSTFGPRASQNFVIVSMTGSGSTAGLFGVDFDATMLGNGCSPANNVTSTANSGPYEIGPAGGVFVCPAGDTGCTVAGTTYTNNINLKTGTAGTNVTP